MPYAKFTLRFEGNKGHNYGNNIPLKSARSHRADDPFDTMHPWEESLEMQADANGALPQVWVLSSDVINQPKLQAIPSPVTAGNEPVVLGEIACDFAPSISYRNFVPKNAAGEPIADPNDEDTGWVINFPHLVDENNNTGMTPAKVYLKFKKPSDSEPPISGQLQFVNGHNVRISIDSVEVFDSETGEIDTITGTPTQLKHYAYVVLNESGATSPDEVTATRTTTAMGETAPNVYVFGGPDLDDVSTIYLRLEDLTEHKE